MKTNPTHTCIPTLYIADSVHTYTHTHTFVNSVMRSYHTQQIHLILKSGPDLGECDEQWLCMRNVQHVGV